MKKDCKTFFKRFLKKAAITTAAAFTFLTIAPQFLQAQDNGSFKQGNSRVQIFKEVKTRVKNIETGGGVPNATVQYTSIFIPPSNDTATTYNATTSSSGFTPPTDILVYDDTVTDTEEIETQTELPEPIVFPQPSADFNIAFYIAHPNQKVSFSVFDMKGSKIAQDNELDGIVGNYAHFYVDLSDKANAMYLGIISTPNSVQRVKLNKFGNSTSGPKFLQSPPPKQKSTTKGSTEILDEGASYQITINAEEYETLVDTIHNLMTGYELFTYQITPEQGLPQHQDIGGSVKDRNDNPISGATVWIKEVGTNELLGEMVTGSDGLYEFSDIPIGTDFYFGVGGLVDRFAFKGDLGSTIDEVIVPADTANLNFHFALYAKTQPVPGTSGETVTLNAKDIADMSANSNIEAALHNQIYFYLKTGGSDGFTEVEKNIIRAQFGELETKIGAPGLYTESSVPLNTNIANYDPYNPQPGKDPGVNISKGSNGTQPNFVEVITPLGNVLVSRYRAEQVLNGNKLGTWHEKGREFFSQVGFYGIMRADAPALTNADRAIWNLDLDHFKKVYDVGTIYFNLENIKENLSQ